MVEIEAARAGDRPAIASLLTENGLPIDGLELALPTAVVARAGGRLVGCAAVEPYAPAGLLRSVCVSPELRGTGLGHRLVDAAESLAATRGIDELFLLTETAIDWFPRLGYVPDERTSVPDEVRTSAEFTGACPESAVLMRKRLGASRD
jgi:amino-acid N-acetyltransferase